MSEQTTGDASLTMMHMVGEAAWLFANSDLHRNWPYSTLFQVVLPAFKAKQARIYRDVNGRPLAYVGWAYLSEEAERRYLANPLSLKPEDWTSGKRGWILDLVIPFGHGPMVLRDLKSNLFAGQVGRILRVRPDTDEARIVEVHGVGAVKDRADERLLPPIAMPANAVPLDPTAAPA